MDTSGLETERLFTPTENDKSCKSANEYTKQKTNNNTTEHIIYTRTANHSSTLTNGGYGLYNVWSDGNVIADEDSYDDNTDDTSTSPTNQFINIHKNIASKDILNNTQKTNNTLSKNKNNTKHQSNNYNCYNNCHKILRYLGLLSFTQLMKNDKSIKHYSNALKVFSEMRYYISEYYLVSDEQIFKVIESFIISENIKSNKLSKCWYDFIDIQCFKNIFLFPIIFGWIEMFLIIYINVIFISVIFGYNYNFYYLKNTLYKLAITLVIIMSLHCIGIVYQKILSTNKWTLDTLKQYKIKFIATDLNYKNNLTEMYIPLQKWFNCVIVTADQRYTGYLFRFFMQKYVFLLLVGVGFFCMMQLLNWNEKNINRKIEKFYIAFQLIVLPIWYLFVVFGIKKCFKFKVLNKKYCVVLALYFILFGIVCIHSYTHIKFFDQFKFFASDWKLMTKLIFFIVLLILNPFLLSFLLWKSKGSFVKNKYSKYYMINILLIYLCITIKIFIHQNAIINSTPLMQNVFKIAIYVLILMSNIIYWGAINIQYFQNNGISVDHAWILSFWSLFLCNYKIENFCYEIDWNFDNKYISQSIIVPNDIYDGEIIEIDGYHIDEDLVSDNKIYDDIDDVIIADVNHVVNDDMDYL